ncbi:NfeD family protein [Shewanella sp. Choline-02u-19]|jgi:membrane protein implicated in regulation of membrane protease activity|uniref:NfeD family protein n=1 Tax=unclassified Shewanella TaxID=196818 RepID=UPI000C32BA3B|nr:MULTISPECIES: NfeD family protein [unclassified Shewanella]PKG56730.1 NfeD family protein [Shewanella sp. GutDb-MelDb]PKG74369.1 NfeD family protein [Shewanella sp. GutCb]PKH57805.1 NfeD family protein [Shewanella sp. Bg11-22]PKI29778.1 NfeD family protein [Shewanella sp. Choline-02u-19]
MELSNPILIWACIGLFLMLAEIILPGGIVILLGAACLVVAGGLATGLVEGIVQSLTLWFITSMVFMLLFRQVTQKLVGGDAHVDNTDEELDLYNQLATVKQTIGPAQKTGRIEFQGSEWPALGDGSEIVAGSQVRVICRDNIALVVEPLADKNEDLAK